MSYSQYFEEERILRVLEGITARFLDIGAWHPKVFSNTRALYEAGWGGICIEPSPGPVKELVKEYGQSDRVQVIAAAVGVEPGLLTLKVSDDAVSGNTEAEWKESGGFYGSLTVPVLTVHDLFSRFGGEFEFVSIDTEGTSTDIFAEMCRIGPRPKCVCVEHNSRFVELSQHAEAANYRVVHENGTNRVYEWTGKREG